MKKRIMRRESYRSLRNSLLFITIFLLVFSAIASSAAFQPKTEVFSAEKNPPPGFSQLVEPNVLLLIDTSGSMSFFMDNNNSTYGDGTAPYKIGGSKQLYYGIDNNPGENAEGNNNAAEDFNYHPNLRYIPSSEIAETDGGYTSYFSYEKKPGQKWIEGSWNRVGQNEDKPSLSETIYHWGWKNRRWFILDSKDKKLKKKEGVPSLGPQYRYLFTGGNNSSSTNGLEKWTDGHWETTTGTAYKYKYPNDSRMYVMKNVLFRILDDTNLVGGLRLALSAYSQKYTASGSDADWYKWKPYSSGSDEKITWKTTGSKAAVRHVNFASTSNITEDEGDIHRESIQEWFDGFEESDNKEFRFDGATPLVASIVNSTTAEDCALDFFKAKGSITDWCQDNWLIVLTDGEDSYETYANTALAAQTLFKASLGVANARPVKTMVIGMIDKSKQFNLAKTLSEMADYGDNGVLDRTYTTLDDINKYSKAYFPQNMQELMDAFRTIFQTIQDVAATGSAPLVNPPKTAKDAGRVYSTGFKPKIKQQWLGYLSGYTISNDIVSESPDWEASSLLNNRDYSDRNIYTADWDTGSASIITGTNLKSFAASESSVLRPFLARTLDTNTVNNVQIGQFISWVRGHNDEWDKSGLPDRWKLSDPYHVGLVEIGAPQSLLTDPLYRKFASDSTNKNRKKIVYMHANDGMIHAFNSKNGDINGGKEEWAFIPPNVLNFPRLIGTKLKGNNTLIEDDTSIPKFLLDGPLVGEDILLNGAYKTVLLGGLGKAGAGLYALDVTDPEKPQFLWALDNNVYGDSGITLATKDQTFLSWKGKNGTASSDLTTVSSALETVPGRLRLTVSTPFIGTVDFEKDSSLETKWIALLGAGVKFDPLIEQDNGGKAVVVLDMADGSLIKEITHPKLGMAVAPLSIEAGPRAMRIGKFYLGDSKGSLFEGDLSAYDKADWGLDQVFTPGDTVTSADFFGIPYSVEIGSIKQRKWLFWGTGDPDALFGGQEGQNYIFSMNRSLAGTAGFTFVDLPELLYDAGAKDKIAQSSNGWRLKLDKDETVTTPAVLYKGYLFLATYVPSSDRCEVGNAWFYILKADTGLGGFIKTNGDGQVTERYKRIELKATRISGITLAGEKVYAGITRFTKATDPKEAFKGFTGDITLNGNLLSFNVPEFNPVDPGITSSTKMQPAYWRDWKP